MNVRVVVADGESLVSAIRRFRKLRELAGVLHETRKRSYFVSKSEVRRAKEFHKRLKSRRANLIAQMSMDASASDIEAARLKLWYRSGKP